MRDKGQTHPPERAEPAALAGRHQALAELATGQHGVVSVRQLIVRLGYSRDAIARACAAGNLHRLHRGVYAVGHLDIPVEGRCLAAMLACGPGSLISHGSAVWLWGLTKVPSRPFAVTVPCPRRTRLPFAIHFARDLRAADRALVRNIPVTALPRTLLEAPLPIGSTRASSGRKSWNCSTWRRSTSCSGGPSATLATGA
jgi:predicted transcriptional regulator of viral defense system